MNRTLVLFLILLLASCARDRVRPESESNPLERDGAPAARIDVSRIPEPVPRAEPRSRYGNQSPYTVMGRTYHVLDSARGYRERGVASWYGTKFHGKLTSMRERYDMYAFTAAHRTLPLPTYVRVTNLETGQSLVVRVNDRGPFHPGRLIDLSYAAAIRLGIAAKGTGLVEVEAIDPEDSDIAAVPRPQTAIAHPLYVQAGSFASRDNAVRLESRLKAEGIEPVFVDRVLVRGKRFHRVRIGPLASVAAADALIERLAAIGIRAVSTQVE